MEWIFYISILIYSILFIILKEKMTQNIYLQFFYFIPILVILVFEKGLRSSNIGTDTFTYLSRISLISDYSFKEMRDSEIFEVGFRSLIWIITRIFTNEQTVLLIIYFLFITIFLVALYKIVDLKYLVPISIIYFIYPFFDSVSINALRQGLAIALFMLALAYLLKNKKFYRIPLIIAPFFHISVLPISLILFFVDLNKQRINPLIIFLIAFSFFYFFNINTYLFSQISFFQTYSNEAIYDVYQSSGNRLDFYLFSITSLLIFFALRKFFDIKGSNSLLLIKVYIVSLLYYLLMGFQAFSDRYALYHWILIPLIIYLIMLERKKLNAKNK